MSEKFIRVLIVDDHALVRMGIKRLLRDAKDIRVVAEAENGEACIQVARECSPDVILLDLRMPGIGGIETTRRLLRLDPNIKVIAVTACSTAPYPRYLLQAGAQGYLPKECGYKEMVQAIHSVYEGMRYISKDIAQQLALENIGEATTEESPLQLLSERELEIMTMITNGHSVQEIADKLCLSSKTVNSYRYRIFDKLNIKNDVELTHFAIRYRLLDLNS
jgi:two-component system invasion response regulator UvrY